MFKKNYNPENQPKAWLFLLPSLVIIFLFSVYPLFRSFIMSFQKGTLINQQYAGLENYQRVLTDPVFFRALQNTALFAFAVVPIALILSLAIAWIIFEKVKYKSFFETIFFMPYVTSTIAIGIVFRYFFNGSYGIINYLLSLVGIPPVNWLDNVNMSMTTLINAQHRQRTLQNRKNVWRHRWRDFSENHLSAVDPDFCLLVNGQSDQCL